MQTTSALIGGAWLPAARSMPNPNPARPDEVIGDDGGRDGSGLGGGENNQAFEAVRPLLEKMGTAIHRCGPAGSGIRTKLANDFMVLSIAQITAEGLTLAAKPGLDIAMLKGVNTGTSGTNGQFQVNFAAKVLAGDTTPGVTIDLAHKDMTLPLKAANAVRIDLPAGAAARAGDYAGKGFTTLPDHAAGLAGVEPIRLEQRA